MDGCLYFYEGKATFVLFDNVPGGAAAHVKRLMDKKKLYEVFKKALTLVENCNCGKETRCYGYLRNCQNKFYHERLNREIVLEFLKSNLDELN